MLVILSIIVRLWRGFALTMALYLAQSRIDQPLGTTETQPAIAWAIILICGACWIIPVMRRRRISGFNPILMLIGVTLWYRLTALGGWNIICTIVAFGVSGEVIAWILWEDITDLLDLYSLPNDAWRAYFKEHRQVWLNTRKLAAYQGCSIGAIVTRYSQSHPCSAETNYQAFHDYVGINCLYVDVF